MTATILIDVERLRSSSNGLGQVALNLGREIQRAPRGKWRPVFLVPKNRRDVFGTSTEKEVAGWRRRHFPTLGRRFDVWHITHQDSAFRPHPATPYVLTIHDLNFLHEKSAEKAARRLRKIQSLVDGASRITTISNFTRQIVETNLRLEGTPVDVIYNAPCIDASLSAERPSQIPESQYLLALGVVRPKKNLHVLPGFLRRLGEIKLVIAGNTDSEYLDLILQEAARHGVSDRIVIVGEVTEPEKIWLLQNCTALVFPSLLEGFGLPLIEAMSYGKPVFCSSKTSLPEIGGKHAYYWHDFDPDSMATVYTNGLASYTADPLAAEKLRARANEFSWSAAARQYGDVYEKVLADTGLL